MELLYLCIGVFLVWALFQASLSDKKREKRARKNEDDRKLLENIQFITTRDFDKRFRIDTEIGYVYSYEKMRSDAEKSLKLQAAKLGANGIIKVFSQRETKKTQAGTGPKGNPYFKTVVTMKWEGMAVEASPRAQTTKVSATEKAQTNYGNVVSPTVASKHIVIDGNNFIQGGPSIEISKKALPKLCSLLIERGKIPEIFFDSNILHVFNSKISSYKKLREELDLPGVNIQIAPSGTQADPFILDHSEKMDAAIVSNDFFREHRSDYQWLSNGSRLHQFSYSAKGELIIKSMRVCIQIAETKTMKL